MLASLFGIKATAIYQRREDVPLWRKINGFEPSTGSVTTTLRMFGR